MKQSNPRYPIYIPSKGRYNDCKTADLLVKSWVKFKLVVEPQEQFHYATVFGKERTLVLPYNDRGLPFARNWIKDHAASKGYLRHWQLDDDFRRLVGWEKGVRVTRDPGWVLSIVEDFTDRYTNVAITGLGHMAFAPFKRKPFLLNKQVYCCILYLNSLNYQWRTTSAEDTDMSLQVLSDGWCTILMNAFLFDAPSTGVQKGGHTDSSYRADGRVKRVRELQRLWPNIIEFKKMKGRTHHRVKNIWHKFDTPLKLKETK